ncbi:MAG: PD-(D/E)XK nuclease family protein [Deltaproteobacteria bacterium]|nr:PD-(D/E)XK nuclease family protein [Deltaproteobacteria bacterium]
MALILHLHAQAQLYAIFKKTVSHTDPQLIHPLVDQLYLDGIGNVSHTEIMSSIAQWREKTLIKIEEILQKDQTSLFAPVARKDLLAQEVFQLLVDIGFKAQGLNHVTLPKKQILQSILDDVIQSPPCFDIDPQSALHLFGYSFDLPFLSIFLLGMRDSSTPIHLWLVDQHPYPFWIKPEEKPGKFFFKPLNQMFYQNPLQSLDFLFSFFSTLPEDIHVGLVIEEKAQRLWMQKQCHFRGIDVQTTDTFCGESFSIILGSTATLCNFAFDAVYIFDFWYHPLSTSSLWSHVERNTMHKQGVLCSDTYYMHRLMDHLSKQSQAIYFVFDQQEKVPFLFFHPDEQADPLPYLLPTTASEDFNFTARMQKHRDACQSAYWFDEETQVKQPSQEMTLSPTSLTQLSRCPRQFYFRHILKAARKEQETILFKQDAKDFGIMIHYFLQYFFQDPNHSTDFDHTFAKHRHVTISRFRANIAQNYQAIWEKEMHTYFISLQNYLRQEIASGWKVDAVEYHWHDQGHAFAEFIAEMDMRITWSGQIDRIDKNNNRMRLIDYKTGNVVKKKTDLFEGGKFIQMPMYQHYMASQFPDQDIEAEIHQISSTTVQSKAHIDHATYSKEKVALGELINELLQPLQSNRFKPNPGVQNDHCRYCDYVDLCGPYLQESLQNKVSKNAPNNRKTL